MTKEEKRLQEIEVEMENLKQILKDKEDEFFKESKSSYAFYEKLRYPYTKPLANLNAEKRQIMPYKLSEISDYGDVMSLKEFVDCVKDGGFIDYDGYGYYVKDNKESNVMIIPSDIEKKRVRKDFDKIIWFNR